MKSYPEFQESGPQWSQSSEGANDGGWTGQQGSPASTPDRGRWSGFDFGYTMAETTPMKRIWRKMLILELCFFALAVAHIPFSYFGDAFTMRHTINMPCGFDRACLYDNPLAGWFDYVLHEDGGSNILNAIATGESDIYFFFHSMTIYNYESSLLTEAVMISSWMILLNLAYFGGWMLLRMMTVPSARKEIGPTATFKRDP